MPQKEKYLLYFFPARIGSYLLNALISQCLFLRCQNAHRVLNKPPLAKCGTNIRPQYGRDGPANLRSVNKIAMQIRCHGTSASCYQARQEQCIYTNKNNSDKNKLEKNVGLFQETKYWEMRQSNKLSSLAS